MFGLTPYNRRNGSVDRRSRDPFDLEHVFENFFNDAVFPAFYSNSGQMRVDIRENDKDYVVEAELPGCKKDDIQVDLRDDRLTISVERDESTQEEQQNYIRRERRCSAMSRSFSVENIRQEDIAAKFENGVLTISLPKAEPNTKQQRRIDIG